MSTPPTYEARMWYSVVSKDITETCVNYGNVTTTAPVYCPDGITFSLVCGRCNGKPEIIEATKLDPQPVFDE